MHYLIDGYNLMHALGLIPKALKPKQLQRARTHLLERLELRRGQRPDELTVVFDAQRPPPDRADAFDYKSLHVRFSRKALADDWMADFIAGQATPSRWTLVSDDRRIRQAGARRGAGVLKCLDFIDHWESPSGPVAPVPSVDEEKSAQLSSGQNAELLRAFTEETNAPGTDGRAKRPRSGCR